MDQMSFHQRRMQPALILAQQAAARGEVPVGAVIYHKGEIIARAYNTREWTKNGATHAELIAIQRACQKLGGWRLHECQLYVTLEPCLMCAGAIINTRIPLVVYGTDDPKAGCFGSVMDARNFPFNHKPEIVAGICQPEARKLLTDFFKELRR